MTVSDSALILVRRGPPVVCGCHISLCVFDILIVLLLTSASTHCLSLALSLSLFCALSLSLFCGLSCARSLSLSLTHTYTRGNPAHVQCTQLFSVKDSRKKKSS